VIDSKTDVHVIIIIIIIIITQLVTKLVNYMSQNMTTDRESSQLDHQRFAVAEAANREHWMFSDNMNIDGSVLFHFELFLDQWHWPIGRLFQTHDSVKQYVMYDWLIIVIDVSIKILFGVKWQPG